MTATPDFVLSGAVDGHLRAYATSHGAVLWDYDTAKPFTTVNGVKAPMAVRLTPLARPLPGGMLFVNSGYGLYGGQAGNVLIWDSRRGRDPGKLSVTAADRPSRLYRSVRLLV